MTATTGSHTDMHGNAVVILITVQCHAEAAPVTEASLTGDKS